MEVNFEHVDFIYNKKTKLNNKVLDDVNLKIEEGKITSIIGKSGSGKTTLVELINALNIPDEGKIKVGEFEFDKKTIKKIKNINDLRVNVGLLFQFPEDQFFNMTVFDEISFGMKYFKNLSANVEKKVFAALKMVGLNDDYLYKNPFKLSNGEKRKIAIASVLSYNPNILILDEPTIGLDSISKRNLILLLRNLKTKYNKTIILISHDIEMVHQLSDHIILMNKGKVILEGNKFEVFKQVDVLKENGIAVPKIIEFSNLVKEKKGVNIGLRDDINDLLKDIYRHAR